MQRVSMQLCFEIIRCTFNDDKRHKVSSISISVYHLLVTLRVAFVFGLSFKLGYGLPGLTSQVIVFVGLSFRNTLLKLYRPRKRKSKMYEAERRIWKRGRLEVRLLKLINNS